MSLLLSQSWHRGLRLTSRIVVSLTVVSLTVGCSKPYTSITVLNQAVERHDVETVRSELSKTLEPSTTLDRLLGRGVAIPSLLNKLDGSLAGSPLHLAAHDGRTAIVDTLVRAGVHVDLRLEDGITPLFLATGAGHSETVRKLLDLGASANVNVSGPAGRDMLTLAVSTKKTDIVKMLVEKGAHVSSTEEVTSPLCDAADLGNAEMVEILLSAGAASKCIRNPFPYLSTPNPAVTHIIMSRLDEMPPALLASMASNERVKQAFLQESQRYWNSKVVRSKTVGPRLVEGQR